MRPPSNVFRGFCSIFFASFDFCFIGTSVLHHFISDVVRWDCFCRFHTEIRLVFHVLYHFISNIDRMST